MPHTKSFNTLSIAVTGVTGMVGSYLVKQLLVTGCKIKVLVRNNIFTDNRVESVIGDLTSDDALQYLLKGVHVVFHCAAELHNTDKMYETNALGTEHLAQHALKAGVSVFCHISSAGVTGPSVKHWIDESTQCQPSNPYECSKLEAEQKLQSLAIGNMRICMLRPTNIIDDDRPGLLALPLRNSWLDQLSCFIKGGEAAHLIHALDVAAAAIYLAVKSNAVGPFFIGYDEDNLNTVSGTYSMVRGYLTKSTISCRHLPTSVPYTLRRLLRGSSLHGHTHFSSSRLLSMGFTFELGLQKAVERVCAWQMK